jgi:hypothetical protein
MQTQLSVGLEPTRYNGRAKDASPSMGSECSEISVLRAMMKARLTPVLLMLIAQTTHGQVYFEGLYGDTTSGQGISKGGTVSVEDGYLSWAYSNGNYMPYLFRVDEEGNLTDELFMPQPDSINRLSHTILTVSDTSFVGLTSVRVLTQPSDVRCDFGLVKFGINGDVIWEHIYGMPDRYEIPQRVVQTTDDGFAMVGQAMMGIGSSEHGDVYLIRTDTNGEQLWERTYGGLQYDAGLDLLQTSDGGFLLLGWTYSYGEGQRDFYLIKTDSLGNQQWQETYGGDGVEGGQSIMELADGNYLLIGGGSPDGVDSHGRLYKVAPDGAMIWTENYSMQNGNSLFTSVELSDGSLVSTGLTTADGEGNAGWLIKTDREGQELWQRKYNKNEHTDLFYSILHTEDGGFLLSGVARNSETNSPDAWLLKVDSVGCTYADCLVGVDELNNSKVVADVWPNPASQFINIAWQRQGEAEIRLIDMSGKEVLREQSFEQQEAIDVSGLPNGLYVLQLVQGEVSSSLRVVVQH